MARKLAVTEFLSLDGVMEAPHRLAPCVSTLNANVGGPEEALREARTFKSSRKGFSLSGTSVASPDDFCNPQPPGAVPLTSARMSHVITGR
jgi:hypothetical protein